ncbi:hypothetical protein [Roseiflexus sp.]|uniref:hypothetical protein n=1 Tax=Roseiflexus sp. TaxID=2562120 RepID=UPI002590B7E0|nr:hypothetical protein [Roseiflexus sp.]
MIKVTAGAPCLPVAEVQPSGAVSSIPVQDGFPHRIIRAVASEIASPGCAGRGMTGRGEGIALPGCAGRGMTGRGEGIALPGCAGLAMTRWGEGMASSGDAGGAVTRLLRPAAPVAD